MRCVEQLATHLLTYGSSLDSLGRRSYAFPSEQAWGGEADKRRRVGEGWRTPREGVEASSRCAGVCTYSHSRRWAGDGR